MLSKIPKLTPMEPIPKASARREDEAPFKVAIDAQLYHALTYESEKSGMSLYTFVAQKLKSTVSSVQERVE